MVSVNMTLIFHEALLGVGLLLVSHESQETGRKREKVLEGDGGVKEGRQTI